MIRYVSKCSMGTKMAHETKIDKARMTENVALAIHQRIYASSIVPI